MQGVQAVNRGLLFLLIIAFGVIARAEETETLTLRLTRRFDELWEKGDAAGMYAFLDPDCIYKTPFRTEIGRDAVRDHVFKNFPKFKQNVSTEDFSKIEDTMAYSTGVCTFNEVDVTGAVKAKWVSKYLHIFTRQPGGEWKMRFHIVHEDSAREKEKPASAPDPSAEKKSG